MPKERQRERETGTWRVALQCCVFIYVSYCIPTKPALNNQGWSWWVKPDFLGCLRVVLSKSAFLCPTAGFAVSPTQTVIWAFCFRMSVCAAYCASKSSMGICCQRAAMLTILAIFESIYRQTNRTGGQYFKKICRCALPGRLEFGDSNERKSGAISGVKTGAISGTNYPTFAFIGNREESTWEKFPTGTLWSNRVDFASAFSILKTLPL